MSGNFEVNSYYYEVLPKAKFFSRFIGPVAWFYNLMRKTASDVENSAYLHVHRFTLIFVLVFVLFTV